MRLCFVLFFLSLATALTAKTFRGPGGLHSKVQLRSERLETKPGEEFFIAVEIDLDKGWHTYYKNPGDSGVAATLKPAGADIVFGNIVYPPPEKIVAPPLTSYGYHDRVVLLVPVTLTAGKIAGKLDYLECRESCIPAGGAFSLPVKSADKSTGDSDEVIFFSKTRAALPRPSPFEIEKLSADRFVMCLPVAPLEVLAIADPLGQVDIAAPKAVIDGKALQLEFPTGKKRSDGLLLSIRDKDTWSHYTVALPQAGDETPVALFFLFAVLGGLLLNFMPCVLPVLSLKAMSLANAKPHPNPSPNRGGVPKAGWGHALPYTLGVIGAFSAVGALFLILRASGQMVGWGFQMQNPMFIAAMAFLFAAMALNLFGVFEIRVPALNTRPAIGEAMTGVIAVIAATPCTAPFMASALGAALTLPAAAGFLMFPLLGLGMALPFLLIAVFPRAGKMLPRPGAWLITFKGVLGFMMAGSALWLIWVFAALTNAAFSLLTAILIFAFFLYIYGKHQVAPARLPVKIFRYIVMVLALGFAIRFTIVGLTPAEKTNAEAGIWRNFSPAARDAELALKRPVFIDFTAEWCLSCKVNEQVAFTEKVMKAFAGRGVSLFKADFTNLDDIIAAELTRLGRAGVPVYAFYDKQGNLRLLPQVLTEGMMLENIQNLTN